MLRFDRYGTFGFDLGIYDQGTWLLSRGRGSVRHDPRARVVRPPRRTSSCWPWRRFYRPRRGTDLPARRAGAGPGRAARSRSSCSPATCCARSGPASRSRPRCCSIRTYQWLTWEFFHPDAVAIGPLLSSRTGPRANKRWRLVHRRRRARRALQGGPGSRGRRRSASSSLFRGDRRAAARSSPPRRPPTSSSRPACSSRTRTAIGPFYDSFFVGLGNSPTEVAYHSIRHPVGTWRLADAKDRRNWYWNVFAPWAFMPLLDLPGARGRAAPRSSSTSCRRSRTHRDYRFHYSAIVVAGCALATVEAIAWISKRSQGAAARPQAAMVGDRARRGDRCRASTLGCAPYSRHYHDGTWPLDVDPRVIDQGPRPWQSVPAQASASVAVQHRHPHDRTGPPSTSSRVPWCNINWGVQGEHLARSRVGAVPRARPDDCSPALRRQGPARRICCPASSPVVSESRASSWPSGCARRRVPAASTRPRASASPGPRSTASNPICKPG